jgi:hypothetical protein
VIDYETFCKIRDCRDRQGVIVQTARTLRLDKRPQGNEQLSGQLGLMDPTCAVVRSAVSAVGSVPAWQEPTLSQKSLMRLPTGRNGISSAEITALSRH